MVGRDVRGKGGPNSSCAGAGRTQPKGRPAKAYAQSSTRPLPAGREPETPMALHSPPSHPWTSITVTRRI